MLGVSQLFSWFSNSRGHLAIRNHAPRLAELAEWPFYVELSLRCGDIYYKWGAEEGGSKVNQC